LARGGVLRIVAYGAIVGLSVLGTAVVARHLGVIAFGRYTTIISLVMMLASVTDAGMANVALRDYAVREGDERERLLADLFGLRTALTLVGVLLSAGYAALAGYGSSLVLGTVLASLGTVLLIFQHTLTLPLANDLRQGALAALELSRQALWVAGLVALSVLGAGVTPLLATMLIANLLIVAPALRVVRGVDRAGFARRILRRSWLVPARWLRLLRASAAVSLATAVGTVYLSIGQLVVGLVAERHQVGLFSVSSRVFLVTAAIPGLLSAAALPELSRLARDDRGRLAAGLARFIGLTAVAGTGLAVVLSAAAPVVVDVLGGHRFHGAVAVLRIQSFGMIGTFVGVPASFGLLVLGRERQMLWTNLAALLLTGAATAWLAGTAGATGAAAATVGGEAFVAVGMLAWLVRAERRALPSPRHFGAPLLAAGAAGAVAFLPGWPALIAAILAACVYAGLSVALGAVPPHLLRAIVPLGRPGHGGAGRR
jgi:O-antigen/teichoic acid export membrane protein